VVIIIYFYSRYLMQIYQILVHKDVDLIVLKFKDKFIIKLIPHYIPHQIKCQVFVDNNEAEYHLHRNSNFYEKILRSIDNITYTNNIFAQFYRMMHEEIQTQITENHIIPELQLRFLTKKGINCDRYNIQKINEVAAVFSTANGKILEIYVTIYKNNKTLQQVSTMDQVWNHGIILCTPYGNYKVDIIIYV